ncbi:MAG: acyl-ACP thioesterase [Desulfovibrionaceae bacterium]|nr:acyl-ACP thioesterase [Desulfovibrionaceae bacterium]
MTKDSALVFEHAYYVRSYEPRTDGRVSIASVCNHLQDIASRHADSLGFGLKGLRQSGHYWVLARLHLMMDRLPGYGGQTRVLTWPSGNERLTAMRDFQIFDHEGLAGRATTSWVTVNAETHRPDPPDVVLDRRYIPDREHALAFPSKSVTRLREGDHAAAITARRADTDINGHVNNVKYVEFCLEAVPPEWVGANRCLGLDIQFRAESFAGDAYEAACSRSEPSDGMDTLLHRLTRSGDDKEIVRMRTWWKRS